MHINKLFKYSYLLKSNLTKMIFSLIYLMLSFQNIIDILKLTFFFNNLLHTNSYCHGSGPNWLCFSMTSYQSIPESNHSTCRAHRTGMVLCSSLRNETCKELGPWSSGSLEAEHSQCSHIIFPRRVWRYKDKYLILHIKNCFCKSVLQ